MSNILSKKARQLLERDDVRAALLKIANEDARMGSVRVTRELQQNGTHRKVSTHEDQVTLVVRRAST